MNKKDPNITTEELDEVVKIIGFDALHTYCIEYLRSNLTGRTLIEKLGQEAAINFMFKAVLGALAVEKKDVWEEIMETEPPEFIH